ncbi:MAG: SOS response-associated peptidase [Candidatus Scalindua sp.]|jgi:putative SOS response-associated peptidase YedK|nr:SOS response-associated peptidase [Candidatus Scalindua sp.]MBT5304398.1 SOS response-associated peptidase [Candidatus Scalindua sp.]MBT6046244.1 SOS response-associated peptidase [Candidatus Scalindua sp.]MBT6226895.1 SOS response-associated peptidase [Candidatus Scalindua sp.]MBT6564649.1 SOS response-associated peptidase [Candidatus Scalindua sp.]
MCGRFVLENIDTIFPRFRIQGSEDFMGNIKPRYNISPSHYVYIISRNANQENILEMMKWGLVPSWSKDPKMGNRMINARVETVAIKPSFKHILKTNRCLVPCSGFYEWKTVDKRKVPYYIGLKNSKTFCLAGLYDIWTDSDGNNLKTFTIITTQPNNTLKPIHSRMPVILHEELEDQWLNTKTQDPDSIVRLLRSYPDDDMISHVVSSEVNNPENDNPQLIKQVH